MNSWDKELFNKHRFEGIFDTLLKRGMRSPHLFQSAPLHPELTLKWTLRNRERVIEALLTNLKKSSFQLSPHNLVQIKTDKVRNIYQAAWPERILLMVVAQILRERTESLVGPHVYSFRKGRGPLTALKALSQFVRNQFKSAPSRPLTVLKRDIRKYGDSIPQELLFQNLLASTDLPSDSIFFELLKQGVQITYVTRLSPETPSCLRLGIPSGSPLVPPLENFYLTPLDSRLEKIPKLFYGRYGDDFVCASNIPESIAEAQTTIKETVSTLGLQTKEEKQMDIVLSPQRSRGLTWLGARVGIRGELGPKPERFSAIRNQVKQQIRRVVQKVARLQVDEDFQRKILTRALRELLDPRLRPSIAQLVYAQHNLELLKIMDKLIYQWLVADFQRYLSLRKKKAWQLARKLHILSLSGFRHSQSLKNKGKDKTHVIR